MKKFLISIVAAVLTMPVFAQTNSGGFSVSESTLYYGLRLGLNVSTLTGDIEDAGSKAGFNFGGVVGVRLTDATPLYLESGLYFRQFGSKKDKNEVNLNYLELPILIKYGFQVTDEISVLPYLGPSFSLGLGGKIKEEGVGSYASFKSGRYSRPDVGMRIGCGAEYNMIYLEMGYQFGIANIADWKENATDDATVHNGAFFVNVGVNF